MENIQSRLTEEELLFLLLDLLSYTAPFGTEQVVHRFLPKNGTFDQLGNYIVQIGESNTLFCCHMDTVGTKSQYINPLYQDGIVYSNCATSCLGGDDRCGMLCCIALIDAGVPGTYIFHVGEERGAVGAEHILSTFDLSQFKRAIEFDRRGTTSVITSMMMSPVCSDTFAAELCQKLGLDFKPDDTGIFTDVYKYKHIIPEVVNISCGYFNEHSPKESIDADWLIQDLIPTLISLDWESLPVERDPLKEEDELEAMLSNFRNDFNKKYFKEAKFEDFDFRDYDWETEIEWEEQEGFARSGCFTKAKTCAFCEKGDQGDLTDFEVEGETHFLCPDCYDYLCTEASYTNQPRKRIFKCFLPEFEQYNARN